MNVPGDATNNLKIVLNSGKEHCVLEITSSVPGWNPLQQYTAQLTPTNGAYFVFASLAVAAGVWACCKFARKGRRVDAGVPYQQLEMGAQTQQSGSAVVEASMADGWDQGWDDDWDEERKRERGLQILATVTEMFRLMASLQGLPTKRTTGTLIGMINQVCSYESGKRLEDKKLSGERQQWMKLA
ncbi:uncharacterized protein M6B38_185725 [Iris pallida]|uniref:Uncharacterized protein n=1 Tax=Iris pallida TaxID=29817 RepID=A0AAX6EK70_IRIPA|nr:uncharacterized protein M6B38_185725 [Iris pallida]